MHKIGMIGFGEASFYLTADLKEGSAELFAFDTEADKDTPRGIQIRERAKTNHVTLVPTMEELFANGELFTCLTSARAAVPIAKQVSSLIHEGQIYLDMNSMAPSSKEEIDKLFIGSAGDFVEAAVMASVPTNRTKTPVYLCGKKAAEAAEIAVDCGLNFHVLSEKVGAASAMKMIKSVLFKGFIALLTETVFAAERYDITEQTIDALKSILTKEMTFEDAVNYFLCTMATHSERLELEMKEVLVTLESMGENDIMTQATLKKMQWITEQGYGKRFPVRPESYKEMIKYRDELEKNGK